jgi:hypothetical protein
MSENLDWWEPCLGGLGAIIDCLPLETQKRITERLRLLAIVQEDRKLDLASYFSRALSGEPAPPQGKVAGPIPLDERVEAMLSDSYDFRDQLQPQGILSAALKPKRGD